MGTNDTILLDGIIDELISNQQLNDTKENRGKVFEYFAISELLKSYDLSHEQILDGIVDGGDDGGIDGLYFFVNGNYYSDKSTILPKSNATLEIFIITCKHHDTYELNPLESVDSSLSELFDLSIKTPDLQSKYKADIIQKRDLLIYLYRKLSPALIQTSIEIRYISRGVSERVADNIYKKGKKIELTCQKYFLDSIPKMCFIGAKELLVSYRTKRNGLTELKIKKGFQCGKDFVLLVKLSDYYSFITDSEHKLKRYFFEENVRDFLGANRTNTDIMNTLESNNTTDFWNMNNGITILASNAQLYDETLHAENIQIVNGLQTTNTIFNFFSNGGKDDATRSVLVKIIISDDPIVRKNIIQATNNQSQIPLYSLHATDKIQKDIEDILYKNNIYYERKDRQYQNLGTPLEDIVTPLYLASGYITLILKLPHKAVRLKSKFMNNTKQYDRVFNEHTNIQVWINIAKVLKHVDKITPLYKEGIKTSQEKYLRSMRPIISLIATSKLIGKMDYGVNDLIAMNIEALTDELLNDIVSNTIQILNNNGIRSLQTLSNHQTAMSIIKELSDIYQLDGYQAIERRKDFAYNDYEIDDNFLAAVKKRLPQQPWPIGIHKVVAAQLGCTSAKVSRAIQKLIENGTYQFQHNGIIQNVD